LATGYFMTGKITKAHQPKIESKPSDKNISIY